MYLIDISLLSPGYLVTGRLSSKDERSEWIDFYIVRCPNIAIADERSEWIIFISCGVRIPRIAIAESAIAHKLKGIYIAPLDLLNLLA